MVTMKTVRTQIPDEDEALLTELEDELGVDRSTVLRQLIRQGLEDWRKDKALEQLRTRAVTLRKAAQVAGVSYVEMLSPAADEGIDTGYALEDLGPDLERV